MTVDTHTSPDSATNEARESFPIEGMTCASCVNRIEKQLKKLDQEILKDLLVKSRDSLSGSDFSAEELVDRLNRLLHDTGQKPAVLFSLLRIATTQAPSSPGLAETLAVLGRDRSLSRIDAQLAAV